MKSKKGFTLIELLAVIVILAIIALIATPIIIGVIDQARRKAFENTAYGVLEGLKLNYVERTMNGLASEPQEFTFPNSGLKLSGEEPAYGEAKIDSHGNISFALADKDKRWCAKKEPSSEKVTMEDYTEENCKLDGSSGEIKFGGTIVPATGEETHKGIVYFDPTDLTKECNEGNSVSDTGTKTGCMKWYIYYDSGDIYKMILDHNTTAKVAWNTNDDNTDSSQIEAKVANDTDGWVGSPRLITAGEIAKITGNTSFNSATPSSSSYFYFDTNTTSSDPNRGPGTSKYAWLFDRTDNCTAKGCDIEDSSTYGYWTSTADYNSSKIWIIDCYGSLGNGTKFIDNPTSSSNCFGIRPVITISKSTIS